MSDGFIKKIQEIRIQHFFQNVIIFQNDIPVKTPGLSFELFLQFLDSQLPTHRQLVELFHFLVLLLQFGGIGAFHSK